MLNSFKMSSVLNSFQNVFCADHPARVATISVLRIMLLIVSFRLVQNVFCADHAANVAGTELLITLPM